MAGICFCVPFCALLRLPGSGFGWADPDSPRFPSALADLGDWSTATGTETVQSIDTEWERVTVEEDASGREKRFGRVKVVSGE